MILPQCATEAAAEREHHLMNNSKSGRQDIYSSVASERRDKKNPKCKTTKEAEKERERGLKVGNHYNVNSQCLQLSGILPVEGDGSFALMINLSREISWHTCHTRFYF